MENTALFFGGSAPLASVRRIHFIGILGAGMRVAARMAMEHGYTVSGSDRAAPPEGMAFSGITVMPSGVDTEGVLTADLAVYSLAVGEDDPEICAARGQGIPLASRADFLGALMLSYTGRIGVAGTHGKSTVTAMCAALLRAAGRLPTVAVGAPLDGQEDGFFAGERETIVFEACEYKRSFLSFSPTVAVLLNAEWDHPDCFPDPAAALDAFCSYLTLPSVRVAVLPTDDPAAASLAARLSVPVVTFGMAEGADVRALAVECGAGGSSFLLSVCGRASGWGRLPLPGEHNVQNALAAYAALHAIGLPLDVGALAAFHGIGHRLSYRGAYAGASYFDDYAHHPTEIRAGIAALRGRGRLIAVFQPHTYSRTSALFRELAAALSEADVAIVTGVYAARERGDGGASARLLASAVGPRGIYMPTPETAALAARVRARAGDTVLVMGAGDLSARFFRGPLSFRE